MKKILVRGPALSQSGYGTQCRYALAALRKFPDRFDVFIINTNWGSTGWIFQDNDERRWIDHIIQKTIVHQQNGGQYDLSLQVTIPAEFEQIAPINIGYTAGIETTKVSSRWLEGTFKVNKMILTSQHAKYAFDHTKHTMLHQPSNQQVEVHCEVPMEVVGYPVRLFDPKPIKVDFEHEFNFLVVAQWSVRKNLENTIKLFLEEFIDKKVGLVLKVQTIANSRWDRDFTEERLRALVDQICAGRERKCSVHLLHGDLIDEEMTFLYQHQKIRALISLAHGEGFGLPLFEAVYNGLPVLAPAWSGQNDFIFMPMKDKKNGKVRETCLISHVSYDMKNVQESAVQGSQLHRNGQLWDTMILPESQWCYPREWHVKQLMKDLHKNYGFHKQRALKLRDHIREKYEQEKMLTTFADAVCEGFPVVDISQFLADKIDNPMFSEVVVHE